MLQISLPKLSLSIAAFFIAIPAFAETDEMPTAPPPEARPVISNITPSISKISPNISQLSESGSRLQGNADNIRGFVNDIVKSDSNITLSESKTQIRLQLQSDILFDFDKWNIRTSAEPTLKNVGAIIKKFPDSITILEGHTDSIGSDNYNINLSSKRAKSVKNWLVEHSGIPSKKLKDVGYGESRPVAPNKFPDGKDNPEGRQKNRRVEIVVEKK